jgi:hypothetical protein
MELQWTEDPPKEEGLFVKYCDLEDYSPGYYIDFVPGS